jgi:hypothetical protein
MSDTVHAEAFERTQGHSTGNYGAIFEGFLAMGIPESDIIPRQNVLTVSAWEYKGRTVKADQRNNGVKVFTYIPIYVWKNGRKEVTGKRFRAATVYHVSQTD